ncbi:MAG TPA: hypothetical protein P5218_04010 [Planctomycetota bacterium]|nr:hypothetical protein [Planctomycetota bacterium]
MLATLLLLCGLAAPLHNGPHDGPHHEHPQSETPVWEHAPKASGPVWVGSGDHRYLWNADWLQLPAERDWLGSTHGCIAIDREDHIYFSADTGPAILIYGRDGKLLRTMGSDWGAGVHGLSLVAERKRTVEADKVPAVASGAWAPDDANWQNYGQVLWVAHTARHEVFKTDLTGKVLLRIPWPEASGHYTDPEQYKPTGVVVGPDGTVLVADGYGRSWVHRFDSEGHYLDSFGGPGDEPQNLNTPHGLWIDWSADVPTLLVADRENHRIVRFSLKGEYLGSSDPSSGLLRRPCHVQFRGDLGVVSDLAGRITLLDRNLELVAQLGDNPKEDQRAQYQVPPQDWREGAFCAPHCAAIDSAGNLYVMDWNIAGRFTRLEPAPEPTPDAAK